MQVNKKELEINEVEFMMDLKGIVSDAFSFILDHFNSEYKFKTNSNSHIVTMKRENIKLKIELSKDDLKYNIELDDLKQNKEYMYCKFDEVKSEKSFKKCKAQLKQDLRRLVDNVNGYPFLNNKNDFLVVNEFKYSEEFEFNEDNELNSLLRM